MPKFFVERGRINGDTADITGGDLTHITRVLRMGEGDTLTICDGRGFDYDGVIAAVQPDHLQVTLSGRRPSASEPMMQVTLFQGIPKLAKMDYIIEKCTELGISRIVPVLTKRTVVKADGEKAGKKVARWRKIAQEAVKQCGRGAIPEVTEITPLNQLTPLLKELDLSLLAYENEEKTHLREALAGADKPKTAGILIGPEGGFDYDEVTALTAAGAQSVSLGQRILRTETAGHTVLTALMYQFNEF